MLAVVTAQFSPMPAPALALSRNLQEIHHLLERVGQQDGYREEVQERLVHRRLDVGTRKVIPE